MSRAFRIRPFVLCAALLVPFSGTGDALGAHACPHHGHLGAPGAGGHGAVGADGAGSADDAAGHPPGSRAPAGHDGPCTCAGPCHGSAPDLSVRSTPVVAFSRAPARDTITTKAAPRHPRRSFPPFFQPYPNGPPPGV